MSNDITSNYFKHTFTYDEATALFTKVAANLGFVSEKEIFYGRIYNTDKVGSLIHKGHLGERACILKLQILELPSDEIAIIEAFNRENTSTKVRLPTLIASQKWNAEDGYGYLLMEEVAGRKIYTPPFATADEQQNFLKMYQEYREYSIPQSFEEPHLIETYSTVFSFKRLSHWTQIAEEKGTLSQETMAMWDQMLRLAPGILQNMPMEFQHGHLSMDDIRLQDDGSWVLMSNLFWSYRPQYFDTTFHLWAGIKDLKDLTVSSRDVITYIQKWIRGYENLPAIAQDPDFRRKFAVMMAERCIAAVIIDIHAQHYPENREKHIAHLTEIFQDIFDWCCEEMKK